jgi:hypothetical protein
MQFIYIFRNENGWSAVMEHQKYTFHSSTLLRMYTELCRSLVLSHEWKQNMSNYSLEKTVF